MTQNPILVAAAALVAAAFIFGMFNRFEIISSGNPGSAWKVDRLTGNVWICVWQGHKCTRVN